MANVKLRQQGGAVVVTIPARWLAAKSWNVGDEVDFKDDGDGVRMVAAKRTPRGRRTTAEIVAGINAQDVAEWRTSVADDLLSQPIGKEII